MRYRTLNGLLRMALPRIEKCSSSDSSVSYLTAQLSQLSRQKSAAPHAALQRAVSTQRTHSVVRAGLRGQMHTYATDCMRLRL